MERTPFYRIGGKQVNNTDFYRNYWCSHYDTCLDHAARNDLHLDCTQCDFRDKVVDTLSLLLGRSP